MPSFCRLAILTPTADMHHPGACWAIGHTKKEEKLQKLAVRRKAPLEQLSAAGGAQSAWRLGTGREAAIRVFETDLTI
jgi:hypothetical protein